MAEGRGRLQRVFGRLRRAWSSTGPSSAELELGPRLIEPEHLDQLRRQLDDIVRVRGGELAARRRAQVVAEAFLGYDTDEQGRFFELLATEYGVDHQAVDTAMAAVSLAEEPEARGQAESELRRALTPRWEAVFRRFIGVDSGLAFLVQFRSDLLARGRLDPSLRLVEEDLRRLLDQFFDVGLLTLTRVTWSSPASLLEKLIEYEAVHAITSWDDLRNRLGPDRRLFAYQHPALPDDLLIFVEVALTKGLADSIVRLLDPTEIDPDPAEADTAIFYSISNCQPGLAGVRLGDFLIKRVVGELVLELPRLDTFATLSPIPGFRAWLAEHLAAGVDAGPEDDPVGSERLRTALSDENWHRDEALVTELADALPGLCARYLVEAKRGQRALDPVANFHLSNGARVERVLYLANPDPVGQERALGMMVNYRYEPEHIEARHDAYLHGGEVAVSEEVRSLLDL